MANEQKGIAIVWGADNVSVAGVITSALAKNQSLDFTREADQTPILNSDGETVGEVWTNFRKRINISVTPCDDTTTPTIATAKTNLEMLLSQKPGSTVTILDSDGTDTELETSQSAKYSLRSLTHRRTNNGIATVDMELLQMEDFDITQAAA